MGANDGNPRQGGVWYRHAAVNAVEFLLLIDQTVLSLLFVMVSTDWSPGSPGRLWWCGTFVLVPGS